MLNFCPFCGKKIVNQDVKFCMGCGKSLEAFISPQPETPKVNAKKSSTSRRPSNTSLDDELAKCREAADEGFRLAKKTTTKFVRRSTRRPKNSIKPTANKIKSSEFTTRLWSTNNATNFDDCSTRSIRLATT
ncbi:MAG: zinc-ribbon domain-containing protein [Selenomonadaceae bacterium]|nr:zinc-ribbon domain-containing protein [Selenomonadaceae bacterium]